MTHEDRPLPTPRVLIVDETSKRGARVAHALRSLGCSVLLDDGNEASRRAFLPHAILHLDGAALEPDPVTEESPRVVWRGTRSVREVVQAARGMARREGEARGAVEMRASWLRLRGLAYEAQAREVTIASDAGTVSFVLWRGAVHAERPEEVREMLADLGGAVLHVRPIGATRAPKMGSFRMVALQIGSRPSTGVRPAPSPIFSDSTLPISTTSTRRAASRGPSESPPRSLFADPTPLVSATHRQPSRGPSYRPPRRLAAAG